MENHERLIQENPSYLNNLNQIEQFTQHVISNGTVDAQKAVITIPVVVHVLYNTTAQNISDAQIQSQINILNQDFRKLNADASSIPSTFTGVAADCELNFCLATVSPTGAATTGIVRKQTSVTSFSSDDAAKYSAQGGDDAWNSAKYLNLWVCNLGGGLLGYAQFPGGAAATDGVVINYTAFGNTGTAAAPYNKGRTATHEIGHWLNLRHIWGDATCGNDQVADTPVHSTSNYGCPSHPKSNSCGTSAEMFMNYMDYTDDACMYMFTAGQKARMQSLFVSGGARVGLATSNGCSGSGGSTCSAPATLTSGSITASSAVLSWGAVSGASSYSLQYKLSTASTWTTVTTSATSYTLTGLTAAKTYNWQVSTTCSSGSSAYTTGSAFTTAQSTGGSTCSDIYEQNNTLSSGKAIPVNTDVTAIISSSTDYDWFKFTTTSTEKNIRITLSNLPADYDMRMYTSAGVLVASSENFGTTTETITFNNASVATYYIRIRGYQGAFNAASCYKLNASISSSNFKFEGTSSESMTLKAPIESSMSLYPNPTSTGTFTCQLVNESYGDVTLDVYDASGRLVSTQQIEKSETVLQTQMDLNTPNHGIFFVKAYNDEFLVTMKIVYNQ